MPTKPKRVNRQDLTLRNLRALKKAVAVLRERIAALERRK